jgi:hypothetical protein
MLATLAALIAALLILALVLQDAFEVMLLPRRVQRRLRFMRLYFSATWQAWRWFGQRYREGAARERFLSIFGPLSMMLLFASGATALIFAFGLIDWTLPRFAHVAAPPDLGDQLYMSGVTFFTLGYGDVVPHTSAGRVVAVLEAGLGIGFLAVVIGYLPVLYQLFARREAHVIQLDGRAGSPPSAVTLICRHAESDGLPQLDEFFRSWEIWGSDLLESHLSYPMLAYYRSQHDDQSWLAALATVLDASALVLVGVADLKPMQARMTFAMARQVVVEVTRSLGVAAARGEAVDRLEHTAFVRMEVMLAMAGVAWDAGHDGEQTLAALRATYEPLLRALAEHLLIPLPVWVADDLTPDHWERGLRGRTAGRLIAELAARAQLHAAQPGRDRALIQSLFRRR